MECKRLRDAIVRGEESADLAAHLESCPRCSRIARLAAAARGRLRDRGAAIEPDPGFPLRVAARLPPAADPTAALGGVALRALPAALLVALALAWAGLAQPPAPDELLVGLAGDASPDLFVTYGTLSPASLAEVGR